MGAPLYLALKFPKIFKGPSIPVLHTPSGWGGGLMMCPPAHPALTRTVVSPQVSCSFGTWLPIYSHQIGQMRAREKKDVVKNTLATTTQLQRPKLVSRNQSTESDSLSYFSPTRFLPKARLVTTHKRHQDVLQRWVKAHVQTLPLY